MYQYYILNKDIPKSIEKFKKKFCYTKTLKNYIISNEGLFYVEEGEYISKYILSDNINLKQFNFSNLIMIQQEYPYIKINKEFYSIPLIHNNIPLTFHTFKINEKSKFQIVFIEKDDKLIYFYILSDLEHNDFNFKEDISYFIRMLM